MINNTSESIYQILVVNIKYGKELGNKNKSKPSMTVLDLPDNIIKIQKNEDKFKDSVETFVYNTITKKYGAEVNNCQIWLPL